MESETGAKEQSDISDLKFNFIRELRLVLSNSVIQAISM